MSHRHQVVVIGAGFGGLAAAKALRDAPVAVTLVDANNFHTFQPLLYQVATAGLDADDVAFPARGIFHRQRNVDFRMERVTGIDLDRRVVHMTEGDLDYDNLVIAAGAVSAYYGVPGVAEHAFELKSLADAVALRSHVLRTFERAATDPAAIGDGTLTIVISGGGPTGVELAGGLAELFASVFRKDYPNLDVRRARIVLVEMAERLLGTFAPRLSKKAYRSLTRRGVEVVLGVGVDKVEADAVHLSDGTRIPANTLVWTAGVEASPLAKALGVPVSRGGRLVVNPDLSLPDHPEVFAVGDISTIGGAADGGLPGVAQVAIQGGRHAGRMIHARLDGQPTAPFRYFDKGSMATIGRHDAVAELPGGIRLSGVIGWWAWLGLHLLYLIGFRNRANVLVNWAWNYVTYDRGSRIVGDGVDKVT
jgi:NADH dehydrogenase